MLYNTSMKDQKPTKHQREKSIYARVLIFRETYKRFKVKSAKEGKYMIDYLDEVSKNM
jgi:hypothetical protein